MSGNYENNMRQHDMTVEAVVISPIPQQRATNSHQLKFSHQQGNQESNLDQSQFRHLHQQKFQQLQPQQLQQQHQEFQNQFHQQQEPIQLMLLNVSRQEYVTGVYGRGPTSDHHDQPNQNESMAHSVQHMAHSVQHMPNSGQPMAQSKSIVCLILKYSITLACFCIFGYQIFDIGEKFLKRSSFHVSNEHSHDKMTLPSLTICPALAWKSKDVIVNDTILESKRFSLQDMFSPETIKIITNQSLFFMKESYTTYNGMCYTIQKLNPVSAYDYSFVFMLNTTMDYVYLVHEPYIDEFYILGKNINMNFGAKIQFINTPK